MRSRFPKRPMLPAAAACVALAFCASSARADDSAGLAPPQPATPVLSTTAAGLQVYVRLRCRTQARVGVPAPGSDAVRRERHARRPAWHGPSWEALDGSRITGKKLAEAPSARPGSIPQLLLAATPAATDAKATAGTLAGVRFVQRLDTAGGMPPDATCSTEHAVGRFPYFARYVFLK